MLHPPYLILILHLSSRDTFTNLMRDIIIISLPSGYSLGNKKFYIFEMFDWLCTQKGFFSSWNCIILQSREESYTVDTVSCVEVCRFSLYLCNYVGIFLPLVSAVMAGGALRLLPLCVLSILLSSSFQAAQGQTLNENFECAHYTHPRYNHM